MKARSTSRWTTSTACPATFRACRKWRPPRNDVHMEDVHRAGGIMRILGELTAAGSSTATRRRCMRPRSAEAIDRWDITAPTANPCATSSAQPRVGSDAGRLLAVGTLDELDTDGINRRHPLRHEPVLEGRRPRRPVREHRARRLRGEERGVDESILKFSGPAKVFESQDSAVKGILGNEVQAGDVVVIRYEGPKGGPACRRCSIRRAI